MRLRRFVLSSTFVSGSAEVLRGQIKGNHTRGHLRGHHFGSWNETHHPQASSVFPALHELQGMIRNGSWLIATNSVVSPIFFKCAKVPLKDVLGIDSVSISTHFDVTEKDHCIAAMQTAASFCPQPPSGACLSSLPQLLSSLPVHCDVCIYGNAQPTHSSSQGAGMSATSSIVAVDSYSYVGNNPEFHKFLRDVEQCLSPLEVIFDVCFVWRALREDRICAMLNQLVIAPVEGGTKSAGAGTADIVLHLSPFQTGNGIRGVERLHQPAEQPNSIMRVTSVEMSECQSSSRRDGVVFYSNGEEGDWGKQYWVVMREYVWWLKH